MAFRQAKCSNKECASDVYSFDTNDGEENRFCGFCLTKRSHPEHTPIRPNAVCYDGIWVVEDDSPEPTVEPTVEPTKPAETPPWGIPEPPDFLAWDTHDKVVEPPTVSKWVGVPPVADWGEWEW